MVELFPRLSKMAVERVFEHISQFSDGSRIQDAVKDLPEVTGTLPDAIKYAATGGSRTSQETLNTLRQDLIKLAKSAASDHQNRQLARSYFDTEAAKYLADFNALQSAEALRDDVWACLAASTLVELTVWRFWLAKDRFHGGVRNAFQRLWLRSRVLDRGFDAENRWELLEALTEDAMVQIIERPSIGSDKILASAIAEAWLKASKRYGRAKMEPIMRKAIIGIRLRNQVVALSCLPADELQAFLDREFVVAAKKLGQFPVSQQSTASANFADTAV